MRVDLLRRQEIALVHGLAEDRAGPGEEGHVADPERLVRDSALRFLLRLGDPGADQSRGRTSDGSSGCRGDAELRQKIAPRRSIRHVGLLIRPAAATPQRDISHIASPPRLSICIFVGSV